MEFEGRQFKSIQAPGFGVRSVVHRFAVRVVPSDTALCNRRPPDRRTPWADGSLGLPWGWLRSGCGREESHGTLKFPINQRSNEEDLARWGDA